MLRAARAVIGLSRDLGNEHKLEKESTGLPCGGVHLQGPFLLPCVGGKLEVGIPDLLRWDMGIFTTGLGVLSPGTIFKVVTKTD